MEDITKLDKAYNYWGKEKKDSYEQIQNPGAKSVKSIMDKLVRNIENFNNKSYRISDVNDLARCAILLDSYADVKKFLIVLKKQIPAIQGYISRFDTGYKGIHLSFSINGVNTEIQLSTFKAWPYKDIAENMYSKWRNFNPKKEYDQAVKSGDPSKFKEYEEMLQKNKFELEETRDLFEELYSNTDFDENEAEIESILYSYELENSLNGGNEQKNEVPEILKKPIVLNEDGSINVNETEKIIEEAKQFTDQIQLNLINKVKSSLAEYGKGEVSISKLDKHSIKMDNYRELAYNLIKVYDNLHLRKPNGDMPTFKESLIDIKDYSRKKDEFVHKVIEFADKNNCFNLSIEEILHKMQEDNNKSNVTESKTILKQSQTKNKTQDEKINGESSLGE